MPEQISKHAQDLTTSRFVGPFENHILRYGTKGLNLKDSLDALEGWSRHTNLDHRNNGQATLRPGQTGFASGGSRHHSVRKLRDPNATTETRVWGIDGGLYMGVNGAVSSIDTGYSGDPLALVPHRPPLSGQPWMFVGDRSRMMKAVAPGVVVPIGLPAPTNPPSVALGPQHKTTIVAGDSSDGSNASAWTMTAGEDDNGNASNVPTILDDASPSTGAIAVTLDPGATIGNNKPFDSWGGIARSLDLSHVGGVVASDEDVFHLWLKSSHPQNIQEIRVYVVVASSFDPTSLPGVAGSNNDAYVKSFRQNDFVQFIQAAQTQIDAAETARIFALRDNDLVTRESNDTRPSAQTPVSKSDPIRDQSLQIGAAQHEWFELGRIGVSLRRGDFKRIGSSTGRDWSTVTGVILYISSAQGALLVGFGGCWLEGGSGPDTMEVGAQPYDYVYTNYDPGTGAEGNPSPAMTDPIDNGQDALRRQINVTPSAYGNANIRQRIYRRGGSLVTDWFFCGTNTGDGAQFQDTLTDDGIAAAGTVNNDHFQPVPTVDNLGNTILAQPIPALWGPDQGMLLGCGDPHRPGHVYFCIPDEPDHWAAEGNVEVCPPSEQLMNGGLMGGQDFVFSRLRLYLLYPNLSGVAGSVTATPSLCKRGMRGRWAFAIGPGGVYFVSYDGVFLTDGGPEQWISREIDPLFNGKTVNGYLPIDLTQEAALRLTIWQNQLFFGYQDTGGARQVLIFDLLEKFWRHYQFGTPQDGLQGEDETTLLIGSLSAGTTYTLSGLSDAGSAINWRVRTGAISGGSREEKLFGDMFVDADPQGSTVTVQNFLNEEFAANNTQTLPVLVGRSRTVLDAFGDGPQKAHSISIDISGTANGQQPVLYQAGVAITMQPDLTNRRVTNWDDLGSPDEVWLTGITLDCDTGGNTVTVLIEYDFNGQKSIAATLQVTANGRHKQTFSWPAVSAKQVRIHPNSPACELWLLYRADWIWKQEPPRISKWDIHFENDWDAYYTGLDLYCDTFGTTKQIQIFVDEVQLNNPATGQNFWPVTTVGRNVVHLTLPWGRGHVFRFKAVDDNVGLLYTHRWFLQEEPSEQANWNQNFSILGTRADKWVKAVLFECDTFGQTKNVNVEIDGVVVETVPVNTSGRKVVQIALTTQHLGRVVRVFPVDGNASRIYTYQPIFDEEPFSLTRWETQETTHGIPGWFTALYGHVTLKSTLPVTLTILVQVNQPRLGSTPRIQTFTYTIQPTGGIKARQFVPFQASKGVLIKYLLTSPAAFYLYREETEIVVQPWGAPSPLPMHPFGSDDYDPQRPMRDAAADTTVPAVAGGPPQ